MAKSRGRKKRKKQKGRRVRKREGKPTANSIPKRTKKALVDIITPVYGSPNLLMGTIASIMLHPTDIPWHWWIIDDGTPADRGRALLQDIYRNIDQDERVDVITSIVDGQTANLGFAGANNAAAERGKAPYILLLNSDVRVTANWLQPLVHEMESNFKAGVVGCKLIFFPEVHIPYRDGRDPRPAGRIQHAGVAFNIRKQPFHIHIGWTVENLRVNERTSLQAVTGAALLTRRALWEKIGGLDLVYTQGNFEDIEYCLRVKQMGFEIIYRPDSVLYHFAGGSGNSLTAMRNAQIFLMRCGQAVEPDEHRLY